MGVTGLWTVVQPCARPIKIETLNKKRLAVDASIWIYQFLKAVRDKEGNALRNSHVVGFFRRICKLLFVGILPVFVFDGGAPALKRQTISARKSRREGRKEDAVRTAGKLLALQMQRAAEDEERKRRVDVQSGPAEEEEEVPDNMVYVDELQMTQQERQQSRKFKKKDQYHLPELDMSLAEMGGQNDPRIMSLEELESYARQFDTGEDINVYDFSKIDFESPFFVSLPASDRYNILNAARLRSRLRMGHSKEQLDAMFPDRMAFSKFQIERVTERNELTQRLMNINGMNDDAMFGLNGTGRIAGEKGREYVLVKNDGVEGGWALGVVTSKEEGQQSKPIDVDELGRKAQEAAAEEDSDEEADFEDVPIEGLNRLPKRDTLNQAGDAKLQQKMARKRNAFYASRGRRAPTRRVPVSRPAQDDQDSLFIADESAAAEDEEEEEEEGLWEEVPGGAREGHHTSDDEELSRAIALSLENDAGDPDEAADTREQANYLESFEQSRADEARPVPRGSGRSIANVVNSRANKAAPVSKEPAESSDEDDMDLQAALAESRANKYQSRSPLPQARPVEKRPAPAPQPMKSAAKAQGFDGPLPFEKLDLGSSLLGKKKMQKLQDDSAGGFEKEIQNPKKQEAAPLPPWFAGDGDVSKDMAAQKAIEKEDRQKAKEFSRQYQFSEPAVLRRHPTKEVIDLDDDDGLELDKEVIDVDASAQDESHEDLQEVPAPAHEDDPAIRMGDMADIIRAAPPPDTGKPEADLEITRNNPTRSPSQSSDEILAAHAADLAKPARGTVKPANPEAVSEKESDSDEAIEWEDSDFEGEKVRNGHEGRESRSIDNDQDRSQSPEFEDADISRKAQQAQPTTGTSPEAVAPHRVSGTADQNLPAEQGEDEFGYYSDSEDEDLMRQLAVEAEEHARFASTLNHKTQQQNVVDYERELKQLRSQQKKDRRDADEVTHIMITECQQLLKLFGLPYITAPMEAEAQCAELVRLGLVDGIVTDDSDCFLFGGTRVYKNMFNAAKFVECYLTSDLEKEFDLSRQKLIGIAQLLGSDYTEGLPGVGPVTALEILSEFPSLADFRDWWQAVQMNTIPKAVDASNPFRKKFRRNATKLFLPPSFPDPRVELAYQTPEVDSDPSAFQWGVPNLDALRSFLMATIGWTQERTDEVLVPVIRDMNQRMAEGTQSNITAFFQGGTGAGAYAPRKRVEQGSKRMGVALERLAQKSKRRKTGDDAAVEAPTAEESTPPTRSKRRRNGGAEAEKEGGGGDGDGDDNDNDFVEDEPVQPKKQKKARKSRSKAAAA